MHRYRRYRPEQLFTVLRDQLVVDPVELPVRAGDLIGALITRDPSGRGDRWCDNRTLQCLLQNKLSLGTATMELKKVSSARTICSH